MKKILYLLCISVVSNTMISAQNLKALDEKNGFREYKFGDNLSTFTNLQLIGISNDSVSFYYKKTDDNLTFGENKVELIYEFYKGRFCAVIIKAVGHINSNGVLNTLEALYGKGQSDKNNSDVDWVGEIAGVSYKETTEHSLTKDANILIFSQKYVNLKAKDKEEKAGGDM